MKLWKVCLATAVPIKSDLSSIHTSRVHGREHGWRLMNTSSVCPRNRHHPTPPVDEAPSRSQVDEPSTRRRLRSVPPPPLTELRCISCNRVVEICTLQLQYKNSTCTQWQKAHIFVRSRLKSTSKSITCTQVSQSVDWQRFSRLSRLSQSTVYAKSVDHIRSATDSGDYHAVGTWQVVPDTYNTSTKRTFGSQW